ncbi:MAG TPA: hypothetical protein VGK97_04675 [Spongiibacteraceae bacterium]|jgi:hypothetical protein
MEWLDLLQWPALVVTVIASWLVSVTKKGERKIGFWIFLLSNALWVAWGLYSHAYALILLQFCLAISNIHGVLKNKPANEK